MDLHGKRFVITGANSGLGAEKLTGVSYPNLRSLP